MTDIALYCLKCKYDLRGLPDEGKCPECGTSIAWTRKHLGFRMRRKYTFTKVLAAVFPILYCLWVFIWFAIAQMAGGEQGFMSIYPLAPLWPILKALGFTPIGGSLMCFMLFPVGPLIYATVGALVGYMIDFIRHRLLCMI